jgi:hypothetical protein
MAKLPKAIIKKYGITKKAWAVFRGTKRRKGAMRWHDFSGGKMVKHRRRGGMFGRVRRYSSGIKGKINEFAIIATAFLEPVIDGFVAKFAGSLGGIANILKLVAAYFLKKKGGMVGSIAQTIYVIEIYKLAKGLMGGGLGNLLSGVSETTLSVYA